MSIVDSLLTAIVLCLVYWIFQLRKQMKKLDDQNAHKPPSSPGLTVKDLKRIQGSLNELVGNIEEYTETQLAKMRLQTEALYTLCERLETKLKVLDKPPLPPQEKASTRVVPLSPKQTPFSNKNSDRVIDLHQQGWPMEKIAEELRITKGEVQLIVNLS